MTLDRYLGSLWTAPELGITLDVSRVDLPAEYLVRKAGSIASAAAAMDALETGALANTTEQRMVGHYWLRAPHLAPSDEERQAIEGEINAIERFAEDIRKGVIGGADGPFEHAIHVGIGGSALGPQFLCDALADDWSSPSVCFLDNADPDGVDSLLRRLDGALGRTLVSLVSKSGWTPTPMQVSRKLERAYEDAGLRFADHAVATTMSGTALDERAVEGRWRACFRLWSWVGGRTSVTSAVGLLPAALSGIDIRSFLEGAAVMDGLTRSQDALHNPAMLLALAWHRLGGGRGEKHMVVLPYRDRLSLFPRYVQQLVMESVGKRTNRRGEVVQQGLTVYGNKGSTDQHAYVQQLRDGRDDFFATFVFVEEDGEPAPTEVEPGLTLGDYLFGHLEGTRNALFERGRSSITITLPDVTARSVGALIALYERAVGLYAEFIDVNAYDQPGVDKDAAGPVIELQRLAMDHLGQVSKPQSVNEIAAAIRRTEDEETIYKVLNRLARDPRRSVARVDGGNKPQFLRITE